MSRFSIGPGEPSIAYHSYVAQTDCERFLEDQKAQGSTISRIKQSYSALEWSHRDLRDSHNKMKRRGKKRDKFFTRMWEGVKGLWKVLNPQYRLPYPREDMDDDTSSRWSEDEELHSNDNYEETTSDDSS